MADSSRCTSFLIFVGYNYNGFAYYGKKIMGFDDLMSGTLAELNEEGMGQTIGKSVLLEDGTEFTVDGIMTDANQLILYYTLTNTKETDDISIRDNYRFSDKFAPGKAECPLSMRRNPKSKGNCLLNLSAHLRKS